MSFVVIIDNFDLFFVLTLLGINALLIALWGAWQLAKIRESRQNEQRADRLRELSRMAVQAAAELGPDAAIDPHIFALDELRALYASFRLQSPPNTAMEIAVRAAEWELEHPKQRTSDVWIDVRRNKPV